MLQLAKIPSTYIYSSLDQAARKINVAKFQFRKVRVMIVTDLAARGIDIPLLDNVINFHFPAKPKLFVHRVGKLTNCLEASACPLIFLFGSTCTPWLFHLRVHVHF